MALKGDVARRAQSAYSRQVVARGPGEAAGHRLGNWVLELVSQRRRCRTRLSGLTSRLDIVKQHVTSTREIT